MEANEQVNTFSPLPRDGHPAAGYALPSLPPHGRLPPRHHQRRPHRALSPGPSRSTPPCLPVSTAFDAETERLLSLGALLPVMSRRIGTSYCWGCAERTAVAAGGLGGA
jgi:hypothetical protein